MLALTKTYLPSDWELFSPQTRAVVEKWMGSEAPQSEHRMWEYGMALETLERFETGFLRDPILHGSPTVLDVGGAGSPFGKMLEADGTFCGVIDPTLGGGDTLESYQRTYPKAQHLCVTCISVIEHVEALEPFVHALGSVVAPGGLLFLTTDCWDREGEEDQAHFHWMRRRIYTPGSWKRLGEHFCEQYGFYFFGVQDWIWNGIQLYGSYSLCSMALRKK